MGFRSASVVPIFRTGNGAASRLGWGTGGLSRMITGFNTNVRYRGRVFHVQTEDSGRSHPHVISHVYHGGTILASEKREYAEYLGDEDLPGVVRHLMEEQHKIMLSHLRGGEYDELIAERIEGGEAPPAAAATTDDDSERDFGEGLVSEQPLDEMILEYLVDKARDRASVRPSRTPRQRE